MVIYFNYTSIVHILAVSLCKMQITLAFCIYLLFCPFNTFQFHLHPTDFLRKCKFSLNVDYLNIDFRNLGWGSPFFAPSYIHIYIYIYIYIYINIYIYIYIYINIYKII